MKKNIKYPHFQWRLKCLLLGKCSTDDRNNARPNKGNWIHSVYSVFFIRAHCITIKLTFFITISLHCSHPSIIVSYQEVFKISSLKGNPTTLMFQSSRVSPRAKLFSWPRSWLFLSKEGLFCIHGYIFPASTTDSTELNFDSLLHVLSVLPVHEWYWRSEKCIKNDKTLKN